jgi:hypothetical protein
MDFSLCDMKVLLLSVSFNTLAILQITVMHNVLQPTSFIAGRANTSTHAIKTECKAVMQWNVNYE